MSEREAARIGDAVLSWLVKYDLADAGNEYRAEDVVAILNDLAPYEEAAEITRLQKERDGIDEERRTALALVLERNAQIQALQKELETARESLADIARQRLSHEMTKEAQSYADWLGGYDECVRTARRSRRTTKGGGE